MIFVCRKKIFEQSLSCLGYFFGERSEFVDRHALAVDTLGEEPLPEFFFWYQRGLWHVGQETFNSYKEGLVNGEGHEAARAKEKKRCRKGNSNVLKIYIF